MPRKKYDRGFPYDLNEVIREELIPEGKRQGKAYAQAIDDWFAGKQSNDALFPVLAVAAHDPDYVVRMCIAYLLGIIMVKPAVPLLMELAGDLHPMVRTPVVFSLSKFQSTKVRHFLENALENEDDPIVHAYALMSLQTQQGRAVLVEAFTGLTDPSDNQASQGKHIEDMTLEDLEKVMAQLRKRRQQEKKKKKPQ